MKRDRVGKKNFYPAQFKKKYKLKKAYIYSLFLHLIPMTSFWELELSPLSKYSVQFLPAFGGKFIENKIGQDRTR